MAAAGGDVRRAEHHASQRSLMILNSNDQAMRSMPANSPAICSRAISAS
jgi:hypothetical protein